MPQMSNTEHINFTREAFLHPINLGFLFTAALTAFFVNDIGMLANFTFTMAIGIELVYLGVVPKTDIFQMKVVQRIQKSKTQNLEERELFYNLDVKSQKRFLVLKHISDKIQINFKKFPYTSQGLIKNIQSKINELLSNYVLMLDSYERYQTYIKATQQGALDKEIQDLEHEIEVVESDKLRQIKARRLVIIQKRKEKLITARERLQICESQLETMEDALRYIYEQSITMTNPEQIGFQLDNLLNDVEETVTIVEDLEDDLLPGYNLLEKMDKLEDEIISSEVKVKQRS
jgi:hypothetical protein